MRLSIILGVIVVVVCAFAPPGEAASIRPLGFDEVVHKAGAVVQGTVVKTESIAVGFASERGATKTDAAPKAQPSEAAADADRATGTPLGLAVEGGRMIFTDVTLEVERSIYGDAGDTILFRVAGGQVGTERAVVFGMPTFEVGKRYVLFLDPDFESSRTPIVGVNQGFFQVVREGAGGSDALLDFNGDLVVGFEDDRVVVRHNPDATTRPTPALLPAPVAEAGSDVRARTSPEVARYWQSQESPMSTEGFFRNVQRVKEEAR